MNAPLYVRGWLCVALLAPGCVSLEGLKLKEDAGDAAEPDSVDDWNVDLQDAAIDAAGEADTGSDGHADATLAAVTDATGDTGSPWHDVGDMGCGTQCTQVSCSDNEGCASDQVCGPSGKCVPKCDVPGRCVVTISKQRIMELAADSQALYWATMPTSDVLGNYHSDGEIWRMGADEMPSRIAAGLGDYFNPADYSEYLRAFLVKDGYVYYRKGRAIYRSSAHSESTPQLLYAVPGAGPISWALGDTNIAMASSVGIVLGNLDGSAALRTIYGSSVLLGEKAPSLAVVGDRIYFGATKSGENWDELHFIRLVEPYVVETNAFVSNGSFDRIIEPYVYTSISRFDLRDGRQQNVTKYSFFTMGGVTINEDWIYQSLVELGPPKTYSLKRYSLVRLGTSQTLIPETGLDWKSGEERIAVLGDRLYAASNFNDDEHSILYKVLLPSAPCASDLPCSNGKTCGADELCH